MTCDAWRSADGAADHAMSDRSREEGDISRSLHNLQKVALIGSRVIGIAPAHQDATLAQRPLLVAVEFVPLVLRGACDVRSLACGNIGGMTPSGPTMSDVRLEVYRASSIESVELEIVSDRLGIGGAKLGSFDLFARAPLPNTLGQIDHFLVRINSLAPRLFGRSKGVSVLSDQMPCRSGLPSAVRGGVQAFAPVVAEDAVCPAAGTCATTAIRTTAASAASEASERRPMGPPFS